MAGLTFKGKSFVQNHHLLVKYHQLVPHKDKCIYIDPAYNTGTENWVCNDNGNSPMMFGLTR